MTDIPIEDLGIKDLRPLLKNKEWRMEHLYYVKDEQGTKVKFKMRDAQYLVFSSSHPREIILKSRQHGITTLKCIDFLDECLFNPNLESLIIAHIKDDAKAFFENKVKFAYDNLPEIIKSKIELLKSNVGELKLSNGSRIVVSLSGRSGTWQMVHISELGPMCANTPEKAREVKTGTLNAVHEGAKISIESTAKGNEGLFYDMCKNAQDQQLSGSPLSPLDFKFFFLPWFEDPKNSTDASNIVIVSKMESYFEELKTKHDINLSMGQKAWYISKWNVQGDDIWAEHPSTPDEAFKGSMEGTFYKREFQKIRSNVGENGDPAPRICHVPYQDQFLVDTWWDLGVDDYTTIWFTQTVGRQVHVIDYYEQSGEGLQHYATYLQERADLYGYRYGEHWGPHDIKVRELGSEARSRLDIALDLGIRFQVCDSKSVEDGIELSRQMLGVCWFDESKCATGIKHLENYRKEWDKIRGQFKAKPLHDGNSHASDGFRVLACSHTFHRKIKKRVQGAPRNIVQSSHVYE